MALTGLSNGLGDFLTGLWQGTDRPVVARMERAKEGFYDYLHALGIEHCNFGAFHLDAEGGVVDEFAGTQLAPAFMEEYFGEDMGRDDYVLLRAGELGEQRPFDSFRVGIPLAEALPDHMARSREVQLRCSNAGIEDGIAFIGNAPLSSLVDEQRFFGFVYAGEMGSAARVKEHFTEIRVATFALMNEVKPELEAIHDDFRYNLTPREHEMLVHVARGLQRAQIAFETNLSLPTVDLHLRNLRAKMKAQTLAEAVAKGYRYGLLD